ncbi:alpha/beta hydrolase [Aurantibacter sp.]|uniref:alpha/beta hydrolase n=1 Tax=Aurantibacter sp. TaxID=2807103 RepID=UPI003267927A
MNKKYFFLLILILTGEITFCVAQEKVLYKKIDSTELFLEIYKPSTQNESKLYPAMVFFFGGGWINGNRSHFINQAKYFSKRGMVCLLVDYRTESLNNTTPIESLKDAKSAIRYIRNSAMSFQIDSSKIIASGGSAGGHLAAGTALIKDYNEDTDNLSIDCTPNALVLFNPVIDNGPGGYGYERIGENYKKFSPLHNIKKEAPPTILLLGTNDKLIPVETGQYYKKVMEKVGSRCDLILYEGEGHGFFNYRNFNYYKKTLTDVDKFLISLGYLENEPNVNIE